MDGPLRIRLGDTSGLDVWDAEGGGLSGATAAAAAGTAGARVSEQALLCRLGSAVIGEWGDLAMPLRRAIYERAVGGRDAPGGPALKRQMAQLLHEHRSRQHSG